MINRQFSSRIAVRVLAQIWCILVGLALLALSANIFLWIIAANGVWINFFLSAFWFFLAVSIVAFLAMFVVYVVSKIQKPC
ncbi:MAG: hypothetical protein FWC80_07190 [Firmicutes bacterium]|nr:hypothetical protein [Bacillota bacterium]